MMGRIRQHVVMALLWLVIGGTCCGFGGVIDTLPLSKSATAGGAPPYSPLSGFSVTVDSRWFDAGGYRPVRVRFDRAQPAKRNRTLEVELLLTQSNAAKQSLAVSQPILFAEGETTAETVVLCPMDTPWDQIAWEIRIDGLRDRFLSLDDPRPIASTSSFPGLRVLRPFVDGPFGARAVRRLGESGLHFGGRQIGTDYVESEPLDDWLGYSSADVLLLDLIDLRRLAENEPDRVRTVRRWLLAGGTVWVEGVGGTVEGYQEIDRLLAVTAWRTRAIESEREPEEKPTSPARALAEITPPIAGVIEGGASPAATDDEDGDSKARAGRWRITPVEGATGWGYQQLETPSVNTPNPVDASLQGLLRRLAAGVPPATNTRGWYATRKIGFGRVLAFNAGYAKVPKRIRFGQSEAVRKTWYELAWSARHGLQPGGACPQFGNLMISGVGVAPVTEFQILITLFVLSIGPLNYWLLWRRQQLQMLVVTVPLCAAAVTFGLVGYAALSDGFGVQARVRSITLLNQETGEAVSWSRVSHYVAMAPDEPATLPADCAAYPIAPAWEAALSAGGGRRALAWGDKEQTLVSGWLPSRTAAQHLIVRSRQSPANLAIDDSDGMFEVTNNLGAAIELLLVRPEEGDWQLGETIGDQETAALAGVARLEALQTYRTLSLENEPSFPIGAGKAVEQTLERLGNSRTVRQMQRSFATVSLMDNLGEQMLAAVSGLDGGRSLDLPPRSYLAVTRAAVETPLGWDGVEEVGSFHVIVGRW